MENITSFKFELGSYFGGHVSIEYSKYKVTHKYSDYPFHFDHHPPTVIERVVTEDELKPLNEMIPAIATWEKYAFTPGIDDGIEWSMNIRCGKKQINRAGYNTFTPEFDQMIAAVENLSGQKLFGEKCKRFKEQ